METYEFIACPNCSGSGYEFEPDRPDATFSPDFCIQCHGQGAFLRSEYEKQTNTTQYIEE